MVELVVTVVVEVVVIHVSHSTGQFFRVMEPNRLLLHSDVSSPQTSGSGWPLQVTVVVVDV